MNRKFMVSVLAFLALSGLMGCAGSSGTQPNSGSSATDLAWIYDTPYEPINVTPTLDESSRVEGLISVEGGSLSATGSDGTVYTLDIPSDSLLVETLISLTPAQNLSGLPFGEGKTYSAQLEPEGLTFNNFVTLTIAPAEEIPLDQQILFDYEMDGQAVSMALPSLDPSVIQIHLLHFSGAGVTKGLLADMEPYRRRLGGDVEARMRSNIAEVLQVERQKQLVGLDSDIVEEFRSFIEEYIERVVKPRITAASESCAAGRLAIETIVYTERTLELLGLSDDYSLRSKLNDLVVPVGEQCLKEEYELCRDEHIVHRLGPAWVSILRQLDLLGVDSSGIEAEGREYLLKCLRFELEFDSVLEGWNNFLTPIPIYHEISKVPLMPIMETRYQVTIKGEEAVVTDSMSITEPSSVCRVTATDPAGGTLTVSSLRFDVEPGAESNPLGSVNDILMNIQTSTSDSFHYHCEGVEGDQVNPWETWSNWFTLIHDAGAFDISGIRTGDVGEHNPDGSLGISGWEIIGQELFAKRELAGSFTDEYAEAPATDLTTLTLYHRPQ
jgi:hypothetical protein